jgi:hypothetical protein
MSTGLLKQQIEAMLYQFNVVNDDQDVIEIKFDTADKGRFIKDGTQVPLEIRLKKRNNKKGIDVIRNEP